MSSASYRVIGKDGELFTYHQSFSISTSPGKLSSGKFTFHVKGYLFFPLLIYSSSDLYQIHCTYHIREEWSMNDPRDPWYKVEAIGNGWRTQVTPEILHWEKLVMSDPSLGPIYTDWLMDHNIPFPSDMMKTHPWGQP